MQRRLPSSCAPSLLLAVALLAAACAAAPHAHDGAAGPHGGTAGAVEAGANRDRHGPRDVARYIEGLQNDERVRELDPEGMIRALAIAPDAIVADVGVGPGVVAIPLARHLRDGVVYGVDVEPRQLDALREAVQAAGLRNVVPVLASYGDTHLPPDRCDWIFLVDTYHHLEARVEYLRALRAKLAENGRLVLVEYLPGELPVGPPPEHKVSREQRHAELRDAGFALARTIPLHRFHEFEVWQPSGAR